VRQCDYITTTNTMQSTTPAVDLDYFVLAGGQGASGGLSAAKWWADEGVLMDLPPLPQAMIGGVGGVVGDLLLVCSASADCLTLDLMATSPSWTSATSFPQLAYPSAVSIERELWVTGGVLDLDISLDLNLTEGFDPLTEVFSNKRKKRQAASPSPTSVFFFNASADPVISVRDGPDLTEQRIGHCTILLDAGYVVITGGFGMSTYMGLTEKYSVQGGYLETLSSLIFPRMNHGCTSYYGSGGQETLIVAGGWQGGYIDKVEILTSGGSWIDVQSLPRMRLFSKMTRMSGSAYIVGGGQYAGGWQYRNTTLLYNWEDDSWDEAPSLSLPSGQLMRQMMFPVPGSLMN